MMTTFSSPSRRCAAFAASLFLSGFAAGAHAQSDGSWGAAEPLESGRAHLGAIAVGEEIYVLGGGGVLGPTDNVDVYDAIADHWRPMPPLPVAVEQFGIAGDENGIVITGGRLGTGQPGYEAWIYRPDDSGAWEDLPGLPRARFAHASAVLDGDVYVFGGVGDDVADVLVLRDGESSWDKAGAIPEARAVLSAAALDGKLYVIGGVAPNGDISARVDIFDPVSGAWTRGPDLPGGGRVGFALAAMNGKLHVAGGRGAGKTLARHDIFDPQTSRWSSGADLPTPRFAPASAVATGRWFVIGGGSGAGFFTAFTSSDVVEVFTPAAE